MKNKKTFIVVLLITCIIIVCKYNNFSKRDAQKPYPISWDVFGYYLYLPATFIYHDLGLENREWLDKIRSEYNPSPTLYQATNGKYNKQVIIYNIGYSFIFAPGFFIANTFAPLLGYKADGFSKPYQYALEITAFICSLLGLYLFCKIALLFFSDGITALLLLTILIGSNYFFQITYDGVMPHNFLFTINAFIIWFTIQWHKTKKLKHILLLASSLGLATLCRPTELIWIVVPLFWGVYNKNIFLEKYNLIKKYFSQVVLFGFLLLTIIFIQFAYFKYATGYFRVLNLHSESLSLFDPYTLKFLFSYKKGWLLYTPIMLFAIIGFYFLAKKNKAIWVPLFLFFILNLYIISSWECWWYASSYSQRPMVETYVMMLFPMGYFLEWLNENSKAWLKLIFSFLITFCVILNLFQTWQYVNYIIDSEHMTKKYYWEVFGKIKVDATAREHLSIDRSLNEFSDYTNYDKKYFKKEVFVLDYENNSDKNSIIDTTAAEGKKSFLLKGDIQYSQAFEIPYYDITNKSYLWVRASVWVYLTAPAAESNSCIVMTMESNGKIIKYLTSDVKTRNIPLNKWTEVSLDFLTPEIRHRDDKLKIYYWNMGTKPVLIDDFRITAFEPKVDYL
ncbi:MAG: hypothetical protein ABI315_08425 [Bacteroidia bacterium]